MIDLRFETRHIYARQRCIMLKTTVQVYHSHSQLVSNTQAINFNNLQLNNRILCRTIRNVSEKWGTREMRVQVQMAGIRISMSVSGDGEIFTKASYYFAQSLAVPEPVQITNNKGNQRKKDMPITGHTFCCPRPHLVLTNYLCIFL